MAGRGRSILAVFLGRRFFCKSLWLKRFPSCFDGPVRVTTITVTSFPNIDVEVVGIGFDFRLATFIMGVEWQLFSGDVRSPKIFFGCSPSLFLLPICRCPIGQKTPRLRRVFFLVASLLQFAGSFEGQGPESQRKKPRDSSESLALSPPPLSHSHQRSRQQYPLGQVSSQFGVVVGNRPWQSLFVDEKQCDKQKENGH